MKLTTIREAHKTDAAYWGGYDDYIIVFTRHRDSDLIERSNWQAIINALGGDDAEGYLFEIERSGHWAVGWIEYLLVHPEDSAVLDKCMELKDRLDDYPMLDDLYSEMGLNEFGEYADSVLKRLDVDYWAVLSAIINTRNYAAFDLEDGSDAFDAIERCRKVLSFVSDRPETKRRLFAWAEKVLDKLYEYAAERGIPIMWLPPTPIPIHKHN